MSQDGQYYHYLTKWMFALNRMSLATKEQHFNAWAVDLVKAVHPHFVQTVNGRLRMFWKMSIDLSQPLVPSEGGLDPYDGYVTYRLLQDYSQDEQLLRKEIDEMRTLVEARYRHYRTNDTLDAGEALWLSHFYPNEDWAKQLHLKASEAVDSLWQQGEFSGNWKRRLAFREFGTTIGVQMHPELKTRWMDRINQLHSLWVEHLFKRDDDITPVMFCSSLLPGYFAKSYKQT
uniref:Uncharacterized protein n=1 Tax=Plectus sambesii TaxID=2011161 RepID=A0A914VG78_9BILA